MVIGGCDLLVADGALAKEEKELVGLVLAQAKEEKTRGFNLGSVDCDWWKMRQGKKDGFWVFCGLSFFIAG